ncbi:MAG: PAS domain S-box protein, partial [Candidatus Sericytochromatia bacterium]|nr:PAS domain S-box protein [Candidatus Sericytochromatia bacterium]
MRTDDPPSDPPPDPALIEADVYRCFFERSAGASCLFDLETRRVLQANPAFGALYGYNQDAIAGLTFDDLQTDPHDTGVLLARVVAEGSLTLPYGRQRRRDGRPFPVGLRLFPFAVAGRVVIGQISWDRSGLQHLENTLEAIIAATSPVIGDDYCRSLVRTLAQVLEVDFAAICLLEPGTGDEDDCLRSLAVWGDGAVSDEVCYPRVGSLCAEALRHGVCLIPDRAAERFPGGALLQTLGIQAYVGLRLQDGAGNPLGVLMTMHRSPMIEGSMIAQVLQVVAGRLSAEIGRQHSEQALRRSEADLAAILDSETDSTWSVDRAYRLIVGNARFAEAYQQVYGHLPLPGADLIPLQGPEVALPWQALFDRALAGESFMFSYVSDRSGAPRHHEIAFSPIRSDGVITSLRGQSRDVTDRVTAEIAQQRSEQNLRSVIESSPEPIWSIDTAFRLTAFNVSFSDGYAAVMGRPPVLGDVVLDDSAVGPVYRAGYERA